MTHDEEIRRLERDVVLGDEIARVKLAALRARRPLPDEQDWLVFARCEHCGQGPMAIELTGAMTAYHWDGEGEDPNRPLALCPDCSAEYRDYWTEQWDNYYSGIL